MPEFSIGIAVAIAVVGVGLLLKVAGGKKSISSNTKIIRALEGPVLSGWSLKLFVSILDIPIIGTFLAKFLYSNNFFDALHDVPVGDYPTFYPIVTTCDTSAPASICGKLMSPEEYLSTIAGDDSTPSLATPFTSVADYAALYKSGKSNPLEVAQKVIANIKQADKGDTPLTAFISVIESDILEQAKASAALIKAGKARSVLEGVPVALKDGFDQKGHPTTCGTAHIKHQATEDSTPAKKLRDLGAIMIGKTNMHEIGISTFGFNPNHGTPRNPYDPNRHTGGSSSGSAAAVGAGICPLAVGGDGGGSVRVPAGLCGVVGLKPTYGRISETGGYPVCWTITHMGPITTNVRDCATGYAAMCGKDPTDPHTHYQPAPLLPSLPYLSEPTPGMLKGLRIGVCTAWTDMASPDMVRSHNNVLDLFCRLGAVKVDIEAQLRPFLEHSRIAHSLIITSEMASSMEKSWQVDASRKAMGLDVRASLSIARVSRSVDYIQANRVRTLAIDAMKSIFQQVDVIVTPNTAVESPPIRDLKGELNVEVVSLLMRFVFLGNLTGLPAITIPTAYAQVNEQKGVCAPVSVQIIGRWWEEHLLLALGNVVETQLKKRTPKLFFKNM